MNEFALRDKATQYITKLQEFSRNKNTIKSAAYGDLLRDFQKPKPSNEPWCYYFPQQIFEHRRCGQLWEDITKVRELKVRHEFTKPEKPHKFKFMTEESLKEALGRKWKSALQGFLYFVKYEQFCIPRKYQVVVPIATTSRTLLNYFKYPSNVAAFLKKAQECELLYCENKDYNYWNKSIGSQNFCRKYIINRQVMTLIKDVCKKYNIDVDISIKNEVEQASLNEALKVNGEIYNRIRFCSNLRIPSTVTDTQIISVLYDKYPMLRKYQQKADQLNKTLTAENQIRFSVTIHRTDKFITKIGIRATNRIVNLREHEDEYSDQYKGIWRKEYLQGYFNDNKYYSFDVKSSIYRVQYLLNHKTWLPNSVDLYKEISPNEFRNNYDRECFKYFSMYTFFDSSAEATLIHNSFKTPFLESLEDREAILKFIREARDKFEQVIGKSCRSEIFLHESCIYMKVVEVLKNRGIDVVQVYDSFYTDKPVDDIEDIVYNAAMEYLEEFDESVR